MLPQRLPGRIDCLQDDYELLCQSFIKCCSTLIVTSCASRTAFQSAESVSYILDRSNEGPGEGEMLSIRWKHNAT